MAGRRPSARPGQPDTPATVIAISVRSSVALRQGPGNDPEHGHDGDRQRGVEVQTDGVEHALLTLECSSSLAAGRATRVRSEPGRPSYLDSCIDVEAAAVLNGSSCRRCPRAAIAGLGEHGGGLRRRLGLLSPGLSLLASAALLDGCREDSSLLASLRSKLQCGWLPVTAIGPDGCSGPGTPARLAEVAWSSDGACCDESRGLSAPTTHSTPLTHARHYVFLSFLLSAADRQKSAHTAIPAHRWNNPSAPICLCSSLQSAYV